MAVINVDDIYILGETGAQVDKVTGLFTKDEDTTSGEKAFAQLNIGTAGSNRNLLDNPWFTVNQRGWTNGTASNVYTVDRWKTSSGSSYSVTVNSDGTLTVTGLFYQKFEPHFISGQIVTISYMDGDGNVTSKTGTIGTTEGYAVGNAAFGLYYRPSTGICDFQIQASNLTLRACKCELGSVSTLANDAPPNYETELLKCRAAQLMIKNGAYNYLSVGISSYVSGTSARIYIPTPTPMWAASMKSAVPITGTLYLIGNGQAITVTALTLRGVLDTGVYVEATLQTSVSAAYNVYNLSMGSNATILIDCNL